MNHYVFFITTVIVLADVPLFCDQTKVRNWYEVDSPLPGEKHAEFYNRKESEKLRQQQLNEGIFNHDQKYGMIYHNPIWDKVKGIAGWILAVLLSFFVYRNLKTKKSTEEKV